MQKYVLVLTSSAALLAGSVLAASAQRSDIPSRVPTPETWASAAPYRGGVGSDPGRSPAHPVRRPAQPRAAIVGDPRGPQQTR
jgi:hypothetical protein